MKTDWVAEVFKAMRDSGEDISIVYGKLEKGEIPRWFELPHDHYDGISGFAHLLREHDCKVGELPKWKGQGRYGFGNAIKGLGAFLPTIGVRQQQWHSFDRCLPVTKRAAGTRIAWHVFSAVETTEIIRTAKAKSVTVNSYLLCQLDQVIARVLAPSDASRRWMIPVNLRGAITRPTEQSLHMSFLAVDFSKNPTPEDVHHQVTNLISRGYQWGSWSAFVGGFLLGKKGIRKDMKRREAANHGWTGMFSNLGSWSVDCCENWLFCPPVSRVYPVGAGSVSVNGCLALCMQLHEAMQVDLKITRALVSNWKDACLQKLPHEDMAPRMLACG